MKKFSRHKLKWNPEREERVLVVEEVLGRGQSPCERLSCDYREACKEYHLACADFASFLGKHSWKRKLVEKGDLGRYPTRSMYDRLFHTCDEQDDDGTECGRELIQGMDRLLYCPKHDAEVLGLDDASAAVFSQKDKRVG